jgi:hypothetical protein
MIKFHNPKETFIRSHFEYEMALDKIEIDMQTDRASYRDINKLNKRTVDWVLLERQMLSNILKEVAANHSQSFDK